MTNIKPPDHLNLGVIILSHDYRIIGINNYASRVLDFNASLIGRSVYRCHHPKNHPQIKSLLKQTCNTRDYIPAPVIMNVLGRVLAVNLCRIKLKEASLKYVFVMTFIDITDQKVANIEKYKSIALRTIPVYNGGSYLFLDIPSIYLIKCEGNYCNVFTHNDKYYLRLPLKGLEKKYIGEKLFRVHRCYVVNLNHVHKIKRHDNSFLIEFDKPHIPNAPVARRRVKALKNALGLS